MVFLTINSQPRVNGEKSTHKDVGWGGPDGYVYQKAYVEFFCSKENLLKLKNIVDKFSSITFHAVNLEGSEFSNSKSKVNAVTWGVFPNLEILQPTIVDFDSFLVWKKEAFQLWKIDWMNIYETDSDGFGLINKIYKEFFLVNIVDNDFINGNIFEIFNKIISD